MKSAILVAVVVCLAASTRIWAESPPSLEINAVAGGVEVRVGRLKVTGKRIHLDQAAQRIRVDGTPAVVVIQRGAGDQTGPRQVRAKRLWIDLTDGSITADGDDPPAAK